jgi:hypothetical protein
MQILLANSPRVTIGRDLRELGQVGKPNPPFQSHRTNSPTVFYAADAAPGMMKTGSSFGSLWRRM